MLSTRSERSTALPLRGSAHHCLFHMSTTVEAPLVGPAAVQLCQENSWNLAHIRANLPGRGHAAKEEKGDRKSWMVILCVFLQRVTTSRISSTCASRTAGCCKLYKLYKVLYNSGQLAAGKQWKLYKLCKVCIIPDRFTAACVLHIKSCRTS